MGCLHEITRSSRSAMFALMGWDAWQQIDGPSGFEVHDWTDSRPFPVVSSLAPEGEFSATEALYTIGAAFTACDHVPALQQQIWTLPNLIIVASHAPTRHAAIHTITPQRPRRRWWPTAD